MDFFEKETLRHSLTFSESKCDQSTLANLEAYLWAYIPACIIRIYI